MCCACLHAQNRTHRHKYTLLLTHTHQVNEDGCHNYKFIRSKHLAFLVFEGGGHWCVSCTLLAILFNLQSNISGECYRLSHLIRWYHIYVVRWKSGKDIRFMSTTVWQNRARQRKKTHTHIHQQQNRKNYKLKSNRRQLAKQKHAGKCSMRFCICFVVENKMECRILMFSAIFRDGIVVARFSRGTCDRYELVSFTHSIKITITAANVLENNSITLE